jgi:hypothetical protein
MYTVCAMCACVCAHSERTPRAHTHSTANASFARDGRGVIQCHCTAALHSLYVCRPRRLLTFAQHYNNSLFLPHHLYAHSVHCAHTRISSFPSFSRCKKILLLHCSPPPRTRACASTTQPWNTCSEVVCSCICVCKNWSRRCLRARTRARAGLVLSVLYSSGCCGSPAAIQYC